MTVVRLAAALLALTAGGCGGGPTGSAPSPSAGGTGAAPCGGPPAAEVALGSPYTYASRGPAWFRTTGGTVYATARRYESGGVLDAPAGRTRFSVGPEATPPRVDQQAGRVEGATAEATAAEGEYAALDVPAGRHWLLSSAGGDVVVVSCEPGGVSDGEPVR